LADEGGLESLSMRKLARALGVEAMSLYNHVASKEDVLDGIVDIVVGEVEVPSPRDEWKAAMRRRAISVREMLARHPWASGLIESSVTPGPARLHYHDAILGCLREAGFSVPMSTHAFAALDSYIYGFALQEKALPFSGPDELAEVGASILSALPADEYPYLAENAVELMKAGFDFADEFEFGLDLILDGLDRARRAS
jgi:AcrR family transcriptional regulator